MLAKLKRKYWPQDIEFYARSMIKNRYSLYIEMAGGTYLCGSFPTKKLAIAHYKENEKGRYRIYDNFRSIPKEVLYDRLEYLRILAKP